MLVRLMVIVMVLVVVVRPGTVGAGEHHGPLLWPGHEQQPTGRISCPPGIDRALPAGSRRRPGGNVCAVFLEIAVVLVVFMDICS